MKSMTCKQLGGACEQPFQANTFEEIAELSRQHGIEMHQQQEPRHLEAMQKMQQLMQAPDKMNEWFDSKRKEFEALPEQ